MIFLERKNNNGYTYDLEDIFGTVHIETENKLDKDILDEVVSVLLRQNVAAQTITGEAKYKNGAVKYTFVKRNQWGDDEIPCIDTQTKEPAKSEQQQNHCEVKNGYSTCKFAGVFRKWLQKITGGSRPPKGD